MGMFSWLFGKKDKEVIANATHSLIQSELLNISEELNRLENIAKSVNPVRVQITLDNMKRKIAEIRDKIPLSNTEQASFFAACDNETKRIRSIEIKIQNKH